MKHSLVKHSLLFSLGTLCSRISGLAREAVLSFSFGATPLFDAFIVAWRLPNLLRDMLAEGALSQAFTKVYSELSADRGFSLLVATTKLFFVITTIICLAGIFAAEQLVTLFTLLTTDGHPDDFISDSAFLTRIVFPYLLLAVLSAVFMGALHKQGRFFVSAVAPLMLNLGFIVGALLLARLFASWEFLPIPQHLQAISGLAVGVLIGGIAHCYCLNRALRQRRLLVAIWQSAVFKNKDCRQVLKLMLPMTIAYSTGPLTAFINTNFAVALGSGAVSWLYYAFRLVHLPIALFGVAVGVVTLPALTRKLQGGFNSEASLLFWQAIDLVLWLLSICFVFIFVNSFYLCQLIYQQGSFSEIDTANTANVLSMYALGLIAYGLHKVITAVYYARNRTAFAMWVSFAMVVLTIVVNSLLVQFLSVQGLALSTSIVITGNVLLLVWGLRHEKITLVGIDLRRSLFFLLIMIALSTVGQKIVVTYLAEFVDGVKLQALLIVGVNGLLVVLIAAAAGCLYKGISPRQLVTKIL